LLYQYTEFVFLEFGTKGDITMICTYIRRPVRNWVLGGIFLAAKLTGPTVHVDPPEASASLRVA